MTLLDQLVGAWLMDSATSPQPDSVGAAPLDAPNGFSQTAGFDGRGAVQLHSALGQFLVHKADDVFRFDSTIGFTLAIRVKFATAPTGQAIIEMGNVDAPGNDYTLTANASDLFAFVDIAVDAANKNGYLIGTPFTFVAGTWYLLVFGYDPATDTMFSSINGAAKTSAGIIGGQPSTGLLTQDFHVGTRQFFYASEFLNAAVDDLLIWHRILSDAEIAQLGAGGTRGTYPFGYVLPSLTAATPQVCSASQCCDLDENYSAATNVGCSSNFLPPTVTNCTALAVTIDPPDGSIVQFPTYVSLFCNRTDAFIHYTLDGSTPDSNSPVYSAPFQISSPFPIKAIATLATCDPSPVVTAQYIVGDPNNDPTFSFGYLCDTPDHVGQWGQFTPNGSPDYHWLLHITFPTDIELDRIEIYQTDAKGFWNTGQAWATDEFINPPEGPANFHVFPLEVWQTGVQLNAAYAAIFNPDVIGIFDWDLYGQPAAPTYGFFKIKIFTKDFITGAVKVFEQIISTVCTPPPPPPCQVPPAPTLNCDCTQIVVTFHGTPGHNFQLYRAVLPDCGDGKFRLLTSGVIATNPQSFTDTDVTPGCTYCYQFAEQFPDPCGWATSIQSCCSIAKVGECDPSVLPASVQISGYADGMFGAVANCLPALENAALPSWGGQMPQAAGACSYGTSFRQYKFEGNIVLTGASVSIEGDSTTGVYWILKVIMTNGFGDVGLWFGHKTCGTKPLGTYVRIPGVPFGCNVVTGPATITLV